MNVTASPALDAVRPAGLITGEGPTVTVDSHEPASPVPEPVQSLATTKFSVPQRHHGMVSRARLFAPARSSDCRVVAVIAPPGYGKSAFLAEWAAAEDRRVAWVSLDRFDDDPARLLVSLASACCWAGLGDADLVADMGGSGVPVLGRAAPRLASQFRASPVPFVLMLDDLHELRSSACHDVLSLLITAIPADPNWSRRAVRSSRTCPGCGPRARCWSSGPTTWLSTRPAPGGSSRTRRSA